MGPDDSATGVWVGVLGPLALAIDGTPVEVRGPKRRTLLARLAMSAGQTITTDRLVDALWPQDPPESARASLHSHVSRLRGHLGEAAGRLERHEDGYRLVLDDDELDAWLAESLLDRARVLAPDDPDRAAHLLAEASGLWRGGALGDLAGVPGLDVWAASLEALHREVDEYFARCALDAGHPEEAVRVATELVVADPLGDSAVRLLMRALVRAGRARDALLAAHDHRRHLADHAGLDPTAEFARLEREIASEAPTSRASLLPRPQTTFVGRASELAALHRLLADEHLVTVTGPGGVGKTRLALEAAHRADAATMLHLSPVTDPASVPHALAASLDLRVIHPDVIGACVTLLAAAGDHVLVIDNCEHLASAVRDVVSALSDGCRDLRVLATSREPLGLAGERTLRLAPLPRPDLAGATGADRGPAVQLFCDRARATRASFAPSPEELTLVSDIVRRLDGVPLAIELAAGRLSSLGLVDLRDRLDHALDLLTDRAAADTRHRTLRSTIEWSYDLLEAHDQQLFRHLAVYPDGFDLGTAERTAEAMDLPGVAASTLARLVDASVIEVDFSPEPRYRMLETLRAFGLDRLQAAAQTEAATSVLIEWAVELADQIERAQTSSDETHADALLRREIQNLRAALHAARQADRIDDAITLVISLHDAATWREMTEVWDWAQELIDDEVIDGHPRGPAVLGAASESAWFRGDTDEAARLARAGFERADTDEGRRWALVGLASVALTRGQYRAAIKHGVQCFELSARPNQGLLIAALAATYAGDLDEARRLNDRMGDVVTSPSLIGAHEYAAGEIASAAGRRDEAEAHYRRAIELAGVSGATFLDGIASVGLVRTLEEAGQTTAALSRYQSLLDYWERTGRWVQQWTTLRNLARLLHTIGETADAAFIVAAADEATDAPAVSDAVWAEENPGRDLSRADESRVRSEAASRSPAEVLAVARRSIDRCLTCVGAGS